MKTKKNNKKIIIRMPKDVHIPGYFSLVVRNGDKVLLSYPKLSKEEYAKIFFKKLEENIKNNPNALAEDILKGYIKLWSKFNFKSWYKDSWGHTWANQIPNIHWKWMINYLNNKIYEITSNKETNN